MSLVIRKGRKTKYQRTNAVKSGRQATVTVMVPKRNQRSFLHQNDVTRGPEKKDITFALATLVAPLTASFTQPTLINGVATGTDGTTRIGRKILMKSLQIRYICGSGYPQSQHRVLIVYDKQANGALPTASTVLDTNSFMSPMNLSNSDRFVVLVDDISDSTQSSVLNIAGKRYVKCNLEAVFSGVTSGIASIASGSIFIMVANNADPTVGITSNFYFTTRIRFIDN